MIRYWRISFSGRNAKQIKSMTYVLSFIGLYTYTYEQKGKVPFCFIKLAGF